MQTIPQVTATRRVEGHRAAESYDPGPVAAFARPDADLTEALQTHRTRPRVSYQRRLAQAGEPHDCRPFGLHHINDWLYHMGHKLVDPNVEAEDLERDVVRIPSRWLSHSRWDDHSDRRFRCEDASINCGWVRPSRNGS